MANTVSDERPITACGGVDAEIDQWVADRNTARLAAIASARKAEEDRLAAEKKVADELAAHEARVQAVIDKGVMELGTLAFNHRARTREFEAARDRLVDQIGVLARSIQ